MGRGGLFVYLVGLVRAPVPAHQGELKLGGGLGDEGVLDADVLDTAAVNL